MKNVHTHNRLQAAKAMAILACAFLAFCALCSPACAGGVKTGDIVFAANAQDQWNLWVIEPETKYLSQLTRTTQTERFPAVRPGGKHIAYVSGRKQIRIMDSLTGEADTVNLPLGIYAQPTWAPAGFELAFVEYTAVPADAAEIFSIKKEGDIFRLPEKITKFPPMMTFPSYSPDGKLMACASFKRDPVLGVIEEIIVIDLKTGSQSQLTHDGADSFFPVWSPDGSKLAYTSNLEGNFDIWAVSYPKGEKTRLTRSPSYDGEPSWSPDGSRIAFISSRSGHREIWTIDAGGADSRQVTELKSTCSHPCWVK
ncbi:TolB family protein [Desulfatibacillum aliphaticivorans]|uniref:TolB family protein n=1 Tax=Desulfatibacillum aliphaticivorans TaxID=218208 RepID=UPI00041EB068|nr:PD40 domain-containing protein [Desulfatibacillum aliphaticivorans]